MKKYSFFNRQAKLFKHDLNLSFSNYYEACIILKAFWFWFCVLRTINHCRKKGKLYVSHTTQRKAKLFWRFFVFSCDISYSIRRDRGSYRSRFLIENLLQTRFCFRINISNLYWVCRRLSWVVLQLCWYRKH